MDDWEDALSGNRNLNPDQFGHQGDGAFSPGYGFDQFTEFHTAPYAIEMPKSIQNEGPNWRKVHPRLAAKADVVDESMRRTGKRMNTNNGWMNRQTMN